MLEEQEALQREIVGKQTMRSSRAEAEEARNKVVTERFKTALRRGFHGFNSENGTFRTAMTNNIDIVDRIHVTGRWDIEGNPTETRCNNCLCSLLSALCSLLSALRALLSALYCLLSALCSLLSALCSLISALMDLCSLLSAICVSALCSLLCSVLSALCSLCSVLSAL
jgi:hypothetical protein